MICYGFSNSKTRNKHFKKHVQGKGGGTGWVADMPGWYVSADLYQQAAIDFATANGVYHAEQFPITELETASGNFARWNQNTGMFVCATATGDLLTFHIRSDAYDFQRAILEF